MASFPALAVCFFSYTKYSFVKVALMQYSATIFFILLTAEYGRPGGYKVCLISQVESTI